MTTAEAVERAMQAVQAEKRRILSITGGRLGSVHVDASSLSDGIVGIENAMLEVQRTLEADRLKR